MCFNVVGDVECFYDMMFVIIELVLELIIDDIVVFLIVFSFGLGLVLFIMVVYYVGMFNIDNKDCNFCIYMMVEVKIFIDEVKDVLIVLFFVVIEDGDISFV